MASLLGKLLSIVVILGNTYGTFLSLLLTMCVVFGSLSIFIAVNFPAEHFEKLLGLLNIITGSSMLFLYDLFQIASAVDPKFHYINIGLLNAVVLTRSYYTPQKTETPQRTAKNLKLIY